jgi:hypothetical protein
MLTYFLIAAHLSVPVNNQQVIRHSAVSATVSEIKAQTPRYFLNVGGSGIEVDVQLENSALRTEGVLERVRRATEAVTTYYGKISGSMRSSERHSEQ